MSKNLFRVYQVLNEVFDVFYPAKLVYSYIFILTTKPFYFDRRPEAKPLFFYSAIMDANC